MPQNSASLSFVQVAVEGHPTGQQGLIPSSGTVRERLPFILLPFFFEFPFDLHLRRPETGEWDPSARQVESTRSPKTPAKGIYP